MECFIPFPFPPPSLSGSIDLALLKQLYKVKYIGALKLGKLSQKELSLESGISRYTAIE